MSNPTDRELLDGGTQTAVWVHDGIVHRAARPWSDTVLSLLRHLEAVGFEPAPRVVGDGRDEDGNETLTFVPGVSPQPHAWSDDAAGAIGALLRRLHDATATFEPPAAPVWRTWFGRDLPGSHPVIGHCDLAPWNIIANDDGHPVGFIDWDYAGPVDAVWELAQVAWLNAQLHDDDVAELNGLPGADERARQLGLIVDGYGLDGSPRADFVDTMIAFAIHSAREDAVDYAVTPETTTGVGADGYPFAWGIAWRARSASWMLRNRELLEEAVR